MNLETILSQTHKQLITIKENFHDVVGAGDELSDPRLQVDSKYLKLLGFTVSSGTGSGSSNSNWKSINLTSNSNSNSQNFLNVPTVIVSAVDKEDMDKVPDFLKSSNTSLPTYPIYLWNLDPTIFDPEYEETDFSLGLKGNCNSTKCWVERFRFEDYPDHVRDKTIRAYRPLIIQTMLEKNPGGCVLWLDIDQRFLPLTKETNDKDKDLWNQSLTLALEGGSEGIVGWSSGRPTSTLTHPKMFSFFDTTAEDYYFHRMIDPATLLICNTETVHTKIMLPWIKCSLTKECISPFGAQTGGCRFNKKPLYRYSGCHAYDSSALNVALGITFPLHQPYISRSQLTKPIDLQVSPPSYNYNSLNNSSTNSISSSTSLA